jgi:hypothetical protein
MAVYLVERVLLGITMEQLAGAQRSAIATSERFTAAGKPVRYLRSIFVPEDSRCWCLFEAPDPASVREANEAAGVPFLRVVEALDLRP